MLRLRQLKYAPRSSGIAANLPRSRKLAPLSASTVRSPVNSAHMLLTSALRTASSTPSKGKQHQRNTKKSRGELVRSFFRLQGAQSDSVCHEIFSNQGIRRQLAKKGSTTISLVLREWLLTRFPTASKAQRALMHDLFASKGALGACSRDLLPKSLVPRRQRAEVMQALVAVCGRLRGQGAARDRALAVLRRIEQANKHRVLPRVPHRAVKARAVVTQPTIPWWKHDLWWKSGLRGWFHLGG